MRRSLARRLKFYRRKVVAKPSRWRRVMRERLLHQKPAWERFQS